MVSFGVLSWNLTIHQEQKLVCSQRKMLKNMLAFKPVAEDTSETFNRRQNKSVTKMMIWFGIFNDVMLHGVVCNKTGLVALLVSMWKIQAD